VRAILGQSQQGRTGGSAGGSSGHGGGATRRLNLSAVPRAPIHCRPTEGGPSAIEDERQSGARLLLVGVLTVPSNFDRRAWIRHQTRSLSQPPPSVAGPSAAGSSADANRGMHIQFVYGLGCQLTVGERKLFDWERRAHAEDMYPLNASDCINKYIFHKTLAWFESAIHTHPDYAWYGKSDDDSLINLPRLRADLIAALVHARSCERPQPYAYYGPMRWRLWAPKSFGGCGTQTEGGPPDEVPDELVSEASRCGGGPFPYGDGSLYVLSAALAKAVFTSAPARRVARALPSICGPSSVPRPHGINLGFLEEDVGTGYLILATAALHRLPLTYFPIAKWIHNRFWVTLRSERTLPDENVVVVHSVKEPIAAELSGSAFRRLWHLHPEGGTFHCADCRRVWRWKSATTPWGEAPIELFGCCARDLPSPHGYHPPSTDELVRELTVGKWG